MRRICHLVSKVTGAVSTWDQATPSGGSVKEMLATRASWVSVKSEGVKDNFHNLDNILEIILDIFWLKMVVVHHVYILKK